MRNFCLILLALLILPTVSVADDAVINRCLLDDGTIAFQELPCAEPQPDQEQPRAPEQTAPASDSLSFENPFDNPEPYIQPSPPLPSKDRAACEKKTREAIDLIDAELNQSRDEGDRETYLAELLQLTAQLRECKQL